jgi:PAS domain S-box-containing protein
MSSESKVNVLLVDDHPENLIALEAILGDLGQDLVKAHSGEEALRCLLHQDFAVILLDVQMPGMDGFETATLIRQRERSRNTPIIFLTAFSTSDNLMFKGYALGAVDYLLKPIDPAVLTSKVTVFVDLFKKTLEVRRQAAQLAAINAELRQSEERFRSLSISSPVGIFLTDTMGRCTYTNPSCQAICDFKLEADSAAELAKHVHPEDKERVLASWSASLQQGRDCSDEFRIRSPDQRYHWVNIRTSPMLSGQGQLLGHVGTIADITDRKQAEAAREQIIQEQAARQQAEAANRMKDEFLAIVSHELRTPLNSILGWSQLLLTRTFDTETTTRALQTIERNARSQAQLIEDILDVSRIIRGKLRLAIQPVNLTPLVEAALEMVRPLANDKFIQLETRLDSSTKIVSGDPERLRQIIWNLLSNAIKFTPNHGRVEVRLERKQKNHLEAEGDSERRSLKGKKTGRRSIVGRAAGSAASSTAQEQQTTSLSLHPLEYAQLQVIDTGIGIEPDFLPHVFDRFRQADSTTTRPYGGLGLGLAIASHLVELHGGSIRADSEGEGKGATFTVDLPLMVTALESMTLNSSADQPLAIVQPGTENGNGQGHWQTLDGVQVLVVEDNTDTRDYVAMVLEESGATVAAVASVSEALNYLEQSNPDVLISDIGMPEADGYKLIRKVRDLEEQQGEKIPAIALTAYVRLEDRIEAISAGFSMHIPKPVEAKELVEAVAKLVRNKSQ